MAEKKETNKRLSRRDFLRMGAITTAGVVLAKHVAEPAAAHGLPASRIAAPAVIRPSVAEDEFEAAFEEAGRPYAGATLRCPMGGYGHWAVNEEASKRFTELTGIETVWEELSYEQTHEKTFLDLTSQGGTYDFLDLNYSWFGQFIATNGLLQLDDYVTDPRFPAVDLSIYVPAMLEVYGKWEGRLYGLPWLGDAMVFPYNQVHFEEAGLDKTKGPATWDEVYEFGKLLTRDDRYGFALMGGRQIQAMCTYATIFFGLADKDFYNEEGRSNFDSPEGLQAMEMIAVKLPEVAPPAAKGWDSVAAAESVAQGVCSMELQWPGILQSLVDPKSPSYGQMAFGAAPGGTALGGHGIAVSNYSKNKEAAYLLCVYLTSPQIQKQYAPKGYAITITDLFEDPEVQKAMPWAKALRDGALKGHGWPRTEETNEVFDIMAHYVNSAIVGEKTPQAALDAMVKEINALREERGFIKA